MLPLAGSSSAAGVQRARETPAFSLSLYVPRVIRLREHVTAEANVTGSIAKAMIDNKIMINHFLRTLR